MNSYTPFDLERELELKAYWSTFALSTRAINVLAAHGIANTEQLAAKTLYELSCYRSCGKLTIKELRGFLQDRGLDLKGADESQSIVSLKSRLARCQQECAQKDKEIKDLWERLKRWERYGKNGQLT